MNEVQYLLWCWKIIQGCIPCFCLPEPGILQDCPSPLTHCTMTVGRNYAHFRARLYPNWCELSPEAKWNQYANHTEWDNCFILNRNWFSFFIVDDTFSSILTMEYTGYIPYPENSSCKVYRTLMNPWKFHFLISASWRTDWFVGEIFIVSLIYYSGG